MCSSWFTKCTLTNPPSSCSTSTRTRSRTRLLTRSLKLRVVMRARLVVSSHPRRTSIHLMLLPPFLPVRLTPATNQSALFRSRDWLSANQISCILSSPENLYPSDVATAILTSTSYPHTQTTPCLVFLSVTIWRRHVIIHIMIQLRLTLNPLTVRQGPQVIIQLTLPLPLSPSGTSGYCPC